MIDKDELGNRFTYHPPKGTNQIKIYQDVRAAGWHMATMINYIAPDCREKSIAVTKIEEAVMWANAAIARAGEDDG